MELLKFDKIIYGESPRAKYDNGYIIKNDYVELHIYNECNDTIIIFNKEDYCFMLNHFWCAYEEGKNGYKQLRVYCFINRVKYKLGRMLLNINDDDFKVEHKDRNCLNFRRDNLYVVHKSQVKNKIPAKTENFGINEIMQYNGHLTGYKVSYYDHIDNKQKWKCFGVKKYNTLTNAKNHAIKFREYLKSFIELQMKYE